MLLAKYSSSGSMCLLHQVTHLGPRHILMRSYLPSPGWHIMHAWATRAVVAFGGFRLRIDIYSFIFLISSGMTFFLCLADR